jgi:AraC-like DNA-binding protein
LADLHDTQLHRSHRKNLQPMTRHSSALSEPATISIAFVQGIVSGVRSRGESFATYLEDAGIAPELLERAAARVTADQFVALFRSLQDRRDDELFGFLSRPMRRGSIAIALRAGINAGTLANAMRRVAHTFGLLQDEIVLKAVREGALAGWALQFTDAARAYPPALHEILLRSFWRFLAWLASGRLPAARFDFAFEAPAYAGSYGPVFPAPLHFGQPQSALWLDAQLLQRPVRRDEAALRHFLADAQANVIIPRGDPDALSVRVLSYLQRAIPTWPGLPSCAEALHMSDATLQRRLALERTSFQSLKDELRRDLAIVRLTTSTVSMETLADELGFASNSAFQRAFKSWTGSAPGAYRRAAS